MEKEIIEGWDCYTANYEYDEVKVIAMLHSRLLELEKYCDWEDIMRVGHWIYNIHKSQIFSDKGRESLNKNWMKIANEEEAGYIQAWFSRNIDDFIEFYYQSLI